MKKLLGGLLAVSLGLSLFACGKKDNSKNNSTTNNNTTTKTTISTKEFTESDVQKDFARIDIVTTDGSNAFAIEPTRENKWDYVDCTVSLTNGSDIEIDSAVAGVKARGNWTVNYDKKPLRIKFDKKQAMLGLNGGEKFKSWLLLAEYKDWSFLRNATAFNIANLLSDEYYVTDYTFVDVYLNNSYWGVYLLCEQQEVKSNRVDITEPAKNYEGTDIGYFLEFDGYYDTEADLEQFAIDYKTLTTYDGKSFAGSSFQKGFTIKSDIYSQAQNDFIKNYMQNVFDICYEAVYNNKYYEFDSTYQNKILSTTITNAKDAVSKVIDIDSLVNAYILAEIGCDTDYAWSSFYMDVDFGATGSKKLTFEAPWDFDSGFGNTVSCLDAQGIFAGNNNKDVNSKDSANPWFLLFINESWFRELVKTKWNSLMNANAFDSVFSYIETTSMEYKDKFVSNYDKWRNCGVKGEQSEYWIEFDFSDAGNCKNQTEAAEYLYGWLKARITNLNTIFNSSDFYNK